MALFGENVCENERIGPRRGTCAEHAPLDPPMQKDSFELKIKIVYSIFGPLQVLTQIIVDITKVINQHNKILLLVFIALNT